MRWALLTALAPLVVQAATVAVERSDQRVVSLTLVAQPDDTTWTGWVGLPPGARITGSQALGWGGAAPTAGEPFPMPLEVGPIGLVRFHRVVPVKVGLRRELEEGVVRPARVTVNLFLEASPSSHAPPRGGFEGLLSSLVVNWEHAQGWIEEPQVRDPPASVPAPSVRILVSQEGVYRLTYEDVSPHLPPGLSLDPSRLGLWNKGQLVPITVVCAGSWWGPGDYIEFYAHGHWRADSQGRWSPKEGVYTRFNPYYLVWDQPDPPRIRQVPAAPQGTNPAAYHWWPSHNEVDSYPSISGHMGAVDDEWYWGGPFLPGEFTRPFNVSHLAAGPRCKLRARFLAISDDTSVVLDHRVNLLVNGSLGATAAWGGFGPCIVEGEEIAVQEGQNQLTIQSAGITSSSLLLDYFSILYPRRYVASGPQTIFTPSGDGAREYVVSGLPPGCPVSVFDGPGGVRLTLASQTADPQGTIRFNYRFPDSSRIVVVCSEGWLGAQAVTLSPVLPWPRLADPARRGQYLVVYGGDQLEAAVGFVTLHLSRGDALTGQAVGVETVWNEFSYGLPDPHALRWFLQWALAHWADPPEFVLLLGDGTWDYNGYLGQGHSVSVVPSYGNPASDNFYASLNDTCYYPDIYLGRIPSKNNAEAINALTKVSSYLADQSFDIWRKKVLFVLGGATPSDFSLFSSWASILSGAVVQPPPALGLVSVIKKDVGQYWPGFYNTSIRAAIDSGCVVVNFFGHGASGTWDYMLDSQDAWLLSNGTRLPFFLSPTCFTGDFADPRDTVFAEHFLRLDSPVHGAIGFFGSSGTSYLSKGFSYAWAILSSLFRVGDPRIGVAVTAAKLSAVQPSPEDSIMAAVYNLMGDPLVSLVLPNLPDAHLGEGSVTLSPQEQAQGDTIVAAVTVTNEGVSWSDPVRVAVMRGGVVRDSAWVTPNALYAQTQVRWEVGPEGQETVQIVLDPGPMPDPDPSDNRVSVTYPVLKARPVPLLPTVDALLPAPQVTFKVKAQEPVWFEVATSDTFGPAVVGGSGPVGQLGGVATFPWSAPAAGSYVWRARVGGGAWSRPSWFTVSPGDSGWAQETAAQFSSLDRFLCEPTGAGLGLKGAVSQTDFALLDQGASVHSVSSYNPAACAPENLIGGTVINTDWGGSFYFSRLDQDQWAIVDLGQVRLVKRLASAHEGQALTKRSVWSYFGIESSVDGVTFVDWGHTPDYTDSGWGPWIASYIAYDKPDPIPVRYIRYRYGRCYPFGPVYEGSRVYEVYAFPAQYPDSGWAISAPLGPASRWHAVSSTGVVVPGTQGLVEVLAWDGATWSSVATGGLGTLIPLGVDATTNPFLRLRLLLRSPARDVTPRLTGWRVTFSAVADLRVEPDTLVVDPPLPFPGQVAAVRARVVNAGSAPADQARYQFTVTEPGGPPSLLSAGYLEWLAPQATQNLEAQWQALPGVTRFDLVLDPWDTVEESDETNNTSEGEARVLANLAWSGAPEVSPPWPAPGETVTVRARVVNAGVLPSGPCQGALAWLSTSDTVWTQVPALQPRETTTTSWKSAGPQSPGTHAFRLVLDPHGSLEEVTVLDNVVDGHVVVAGLADLAIGQVAADCSTPPVGDPFQITVEVLNRGGRPGGPTWLRCAQDGGWHEQVEVPGLEPGAVWEGSLWWPTGTSPATLSFTLVVDPDSLVVDADRSNNTASLQVSTVQAPDLVAVSWWCDPALPLAGRPCVVGVRVRNRGVEPAPPCHVALSAQGTWYPMALMSLAGQRTVDVSWDLVFPDPGTWPLVLEVDVGDQVAEACEANNRLGFSVTVGAPWDLAVSEQDILRVDPTLPFTTWEPTPLRVVVRNLGDEVSPVAPLVVYDGPPGAWAVDSVLVRPVEPRGTDSVLVAWPEGTAPGPHVLSVAIDPARTLTERHTDNNAASRLIHVVPDTEPPVVEIRGPRPGFSPGDYLGPTDSLTVTAWDLLSGIDSVEVFQDGSRLDGLWWARETSSGRTVVRTRIPAVVVPGLHTVMAKARDRAGVQSHDTLAYLVAGAPVVHEVAAVPSPASSQTWITAVISHPGSLQVDVYSVSGRIVRRLRQEARFPGRAGVLWDLRDEDGDRVANGVYLLRVDLQAQTGHAQGRGSVVVRR